MQYRLNVPARGYGCIYADPPWMLDMGGGQRKLVYDTMTTEEIKAIGEHLNAPYVLHPTAHLWLWTTNPHLPEAFDVMQAWGFTYKTMLTWDKGRIGLGWWLRSRTEHVLLGVKTTGTRKRSGKMDLYRVQPGATSTLLQAPWRGHSVKPTEVYDIIEKLSQAPYLELFAPEGMQREGWTMLADHREPHGDSYGTGHTPDQQCKGCPHPYHPTVVCNVVIDGLKQVYNFAEKAYNYRTAHPWPCPCGYDIDEGPNDRLPIDSGKGLVDFARKANAWPITR